MEGKKFNQLDNKNLKNKFYGLFIFSDFIKEKPFPLPLNHWKACKVTLVYKININYKILKQKII